MLVTSVASKISNPNFGVLFLWYVRCKQVLDQWPCHCAFQSELVVKAFLSNMNIGCTGIVTPWTNRINRASEPNSCFIIFERAKFARLKGQPGYITLTLFVLSGICDVMCNVIDIYICCWLLKLSIFSGYWKRIVVYCVIENTTFPWYRINMGLHLLWCNFPKGLKSMDIIMSVNNSTNSHLDRF